MDRIIEVKVFGNHMTKDSKSAGVRGEKNSTKLRITFDKGWNGYAKDVIFWDAYGENPVNIVLSVDNEEQDGVYLVPIPGEPMARAGMLTFIINGTLDNQKQKSVTGELEVKDSPSIMEPIPPTPSELVQVRGTLEYIKSNIHQAVESKEAIQNMSVSAATLSTGEAAFVNKSEANGVVNLHFGLPKGATGNTGDSGVHVGEDEPTDPIKNVWINPNGDGRSDVGVIISVKDYGAVGDGKTDDTEALQAAAMSGKTVYFPAGTYLLYSQIDMTASINWIGEGAKSIIKLMPPKSRASGETLSCIMINHNAGKHSISLQGLVLDANKSELAETDMTSCLYLHSPSLVYFNNVKVTGATRDGCYIYGVDATDVTISNCRFNENGHGELGDGLCIENVGIDARITNCKFSSNGSAGLHLLRNNGAVVSNITLHNNTVGVIIDNSHQNTLSGVMCSSNDAGIMLWNESESNTISGLVTKKGGCGMLFGGCDKTVISGWNCVDDICRCRVDYFNMTKKCTGLVLGVFGTKDIEYLIPDGGVTPGFGMIFIGEE